jgi:hypothetical protein
MARSRYVSGEVIPGRFPWEVFLGGGGGGLSREAFFTFHFLIQVSSEEDGEALHPFLLAHYPITVLVKCSEHTIHEVVITHGEMVVENVSKLNTIHSSVWT